MAGEGARLCGCGSRLAYGLRACGATLPSAACAEPLCHARPRRGMHVGLLCTAGRDCALEASPRARRLASLDWHTAQGQRSPQRHRRRATLAYARVSTCRSVFRQRMSHRLVVPSSVPRVRIAACGRPTRDGSRQALKPRDLLAPWRCAQATRRILYLRPTSGVESMASVSDGVVAEDATEIWPSTDLDTCDRYRDHPIELGRSGFPWSRGISAALLTPHRCKLIAYFSRRFEVAGLPLRQHPEARSLPNQLGTSKIGFLA